MTGDKFGDLTRCKPYKFAPCAHHTTSTKYPPCGSDQPTPVCSKKCQQSYGTSYKDDKKYAKHSYSVRGAANYAKEVSSNGPIAVTFSVYEDFLTYQSGVYKHKTGQFLGLHAVRLIGYGSDSVSGLDYWIVTNSWNETWGNDGIFWISKGNNECGIES